MEMRVPGKITGIRFPAPIGVESVGSSVNFAIVSLVHVRARTRLVNRVTFILHPRSREQIAHLQTQRYVLGDILRYRLGIRFGVGGIVRDILNVTNRLRLGFSGGGGGVWGRKRRRRRRKRLEGRRRRKWLEVDVEI